MSEFYDDKDIRQQILSVMLLIAATAGVVTMMTNAINQRPMANLVFPAILSVLMLILHYMSTKMGKQGHLYAKYVALLFLCVLYIPPSWLTSPGSTSAMPYYSLAVFVFGIILVNNKWDLIFPGITLVEVLVLFQVEAMYPELFELYTDPVYRLLDLTMNFTVAAALIFIMIYLFNRHYIRHHDQLYALSITDSLTGLYNRRFMMQALEAEHNASVRNETPYTIILIDINHFKRVNDTYGHLEGDETLKALGTILLHESRSYDICCRYGGDEFLIILPHAREPEGWLCADRMKERFSQYTQRYLELGVGLSISVTERREQTLREMIELADNRLYLKKGEK